MNYTDAIVGNSSEFNFEERLVNVTTFSALIMLMLSIITNQLNHLSVFFNYVIFIGFLAFGVSYYVSRILQKTTLAIQLVTIICYVLLPFAWHYNQGMTGTTTFYFFIFVQLMVGALRTHKVLFGLCAVLYVILMAYLEKQIDGFVIPFRNPSVEYFDFFYSFIITSIVFIFFTTWIKNTYVTEQRHSDQQTSELENSRDQLALAMNDLSVQNALFVQQKEELEATNAINNKLFSIISHDLRSPLANLETTIQVMAYSEMTPEESIMLYNGLQKELTNTSNLLENLLSWAKNQRQGIEIAKSSFDIYALIEENLRLFEIRAASKGIRLWMSEKPKILVWADPHMIRLVLRNLISNALKFCKTGDSVSFHFVSMSEGFLRVEVRDTGIGMSLDIQNKIFKTVDYTRFGTENEKGSGLGLYLCADFVASNDGHIWFESKEDMGSSFYFTIPLYDPNREQA